DMLNVNCGAALTLTHYCARRFVEQRRGGIVLLSSIVAFQGVPRAAHYAATKAYIQSLAEGLRVELRPHHVDVLASAPGPVDSGFAKRADMQMAATVTPEQVARGTLQALGRRLTVRPGLLSKILELGLSMLPRRWRVRVMTVVMEGMTKHQRELQNAESNPRPV
ncbi:MAG: SDR family NAD(P)-dependent oxidoreductase, partial [Myxococcota bacterium]